MRIIRCSLRVLAAASCISCLLMTNLLLAKDDAARTSGPETRGATEPDVRRIDRVFFDYNSATIRPENLDNVRRIAEWLQHHPDQRVTIEGHTDERGARTYNQALGKKRAYAFRAALLANGVSERQIVSVISYGKDRPAVAYSTEAAWAQNRRAVVVGSGF